MFIVFKNCFLKRTFQYDIGQDNLRKLIEHMNNAQYKHRPDTIYVKNKLSELDLNLNLVDIANNLDAIFSDTENEEYKFLFEWYMYV